ncbi:MAG: nickel pincer cofactor biosynthesis protein LarC [Bacillota bacterium]
MERVLFFDCFSGISGDMTIGALLDLGIDQQVFLNELSKLNLDGYRIEVRKAVKMGITGTDFHVILETDCHHDEEEHNQHHHQEEHGHHHEHHHHHEHDHVHQHNTHHHEHVHRNLHDVEHIIDGSQLKDAVKEMSKKIFRLVAEAEAKIHGKPIEEVHFHEVGAVDSIVDIVGTAICIDLLGVKEIYGSPLHIGTGFVKCAHGLFPVPAPATLEILKNVPVYNKGIQTELVTPTGAAIVKALVQAYGDIPPMEISAVGYGLGRKDLEIPNLLRVCLGKKKDNSRVLMLETNIDDMNPEIYGYIMEKAFEKGALDVFYTPIVMKKNRPAVKLSVLCEEQCADALEKMLFRETTTFGIRKYQVDRSTLERKIIKIKTKYGVVSIKLGLIDGKIGKYAPEYEDCKEVALGFGIPLQKVYEDVMMAVKKYFEAMEMAKNNADAF